MAEQRPSPVIRTGSKVTFPPSPNTSCNCKNSGGVLVVRSRGLEPPHHFRYKHLKLALLTFLECVVRGGDLFSVPALIRRKLYTSRRRQNSKSATKTTISHTASHTGVSEAV